MGLAGRVSEKMPKSKSKRHVEAEQACEHYWLIESPNGPTSAGVCQVCGETRDFANYLESSAWSSAGVTLQQLSEAELRRKSASAGRRKPGGPPGNRAVTGTRGA